MTDKGLQQQASGSVPGPRGAIDRATDKANVIGRDRHAQHRFGVLNREVGGQVIGIGCQGPGVDIFIRAAGN